MNKYRITAVVFLTTHMFCTHASSREVEWSGNESIARTLESSQEIAQRLVEFNKSLHKKGYPGQITVCSDIYDLPAGIANGNHSYGAVCSYEASGANKQVFVCNDVMVGHFLLLDAFEDSDQWKLKTIYENCYGG
ncbi:hypothetical protein [Pseudomonas fluorescens]|uniref:Uncharacterized protein n=1 Tax=Pseudomonas fluorescens TaxID=294 RepID=A0A5E6PYI7_PSEFL|nr:hypothetical protein [Pseudomonas fluorescens]VVM48333.1 hypothetical protein PS655_00641 [Pseudomonas fluorescens]